MNFSLKPHAVAQHWSCDQCKPVIMSLGGVFVHMWGCDAENVAHMWSGWESAAEHLLRKSGILSSKSWEVAEVKIVATLPRWSDAKVPLCADCAERVESFLQSSRLGDNSVSPMEIIISIGQLCRPCTKNFCEGVDEASQRNGWSMVEGNRAIMIPSMPISEFLR